MSSPRDLPRRPIPDAPWGIGIVGGGDISGRYSECIKANPRFAFIGVAGRGQETADLLADPRLDIVVNLTPPTAHEQVTRDSLLAGKHVYSEKPLAHDLNAANALIDLALDRELLLACAPATFLGPAQQHARRVIDGQSLGQVIGARGIVVYPGPDIWHHNPAPLFGEAAGPLFDMGVYHLTALVALFGPMIEVSAMASQSRSVRSIAKGPKAGETFEVTIPTHVCALVKFETGLIADLTFSFDGLCSAAPALEIFGLMGSLVLPQPGQFVGEIRMANAYNAWLPVEQGPSDWSETMWIAGLLAMIDNLDGHDTPFPRTDLALHVLDAMVAIQASLEAGAVRALTTTCQRPAVLEAATVSRWAQTMKRAA